MVRVGRVSPRRLGLKVQAGEAKLASKAELSSVCRARGPLTSSWPGKTDTPTSVFRPMHILINWAQMIGRLNLSINQQRRSLKFVYEIRRNETAGPRDMETLYIGYG